MSAPFDPGLQPERTLLAWRRTALALAVASIIIVRFTLELYGGFAIIVGAVGLGLALAAAWLAHRRYVAAHTELHRSGTLPSGGILVALLAVTVGLLGLASAAFVIGRGLGLGVRL